MQLIVLGMHRSGTSSVTRLLNLSGAYFGPEGIATDANDENPKGFWERRDVRSVCDALLHGGGFDWWRLAGFDLTAIPQEVVDAQRAELRRIVLQLDAHRPWVVKEPRLCLLLPILRPLLEAPVFVHVVREPLEIAESLQARNGFSVPSGLALWELYTSHSVAASTGEPRVLVDYGNLMADPVGTLRQLLDELSALGVQGLTMPTEREVTAFVAPSLHRHRRKAADRRANLNTLQASLAKELDRGRFPKVATPPVLSEGAAAALRDLEERSDLVAELEQVRAEADAQLAQAEEAHREVVDAMTASLAEHEAAHHAAEATHARIEADLREAAAAAAEASRLAERRAAESLAVAAHRVRVLRRSGAVRFGGRLATVRNLLRGKPRGPVHTTITGALKQIEQARSLLEEQLSSVPTAATGGPGSNPPRTEDLRRDRQAARSRGDRTKVAVLAWDVGHNPFGRAHVLADVLRQDYEVEIWGTQFKRYGSELWPPLRDTPIPVKRLRGGSFPEYLDTLEDASRRIDADVLWVSKPRLPSLALGQLAKEAWNRSLIVDIDDYEPSFFNTTGGIPVESLLQQREDPDLSLPFGRLWTLACESVVRTADQITVSNLELAARYGGTVIPHARDEAVFDPARHDRAAARHRLGLRDSDRLVLFGGTPRVHKGIVEILEALEVLGDRRIRIGVFATRELEDLRDQIGPMQRWILPLPYHAFNDLPSLLAAADLACALQAPDHPVSRFQMPAKVTDAMAMGVPCLVTPVPPLQPLIDKDVVEVFDGDRPLHERIREIFANADETADRGRRARELFLESYSYAAVRPLAAAVIEDKIDEPPAPSPSLGSLITTAKAMYRPALAAAAVAPPVVQRRQLPAGTTYDLVVFWKQNDTGIYGRRQDMFLKYLERSGRFKTIVHFDQPMSADALVDVARRSIGSTDQNRLVLQQTVRRLARRGDHGAVRERTFLYGTGRASKALRVPPRSGYVPFVKAVLQREGVGLGNRPVMVWVYPTNPFLPDVIDAIQPDLVVADVVDDNRTWYAPGMPAYERLERNYEEVLARSDLVLANCEPVAASMHAFTDRIEVIPNACELPEGPRGPRPAELQGIAGPIVGYAGNLSDRIDLPLLRQLVRTRRDWTFVFLGSTHLDQSALQLAKETNVRFIGTKRYDEAREIISHFDVALIPHVDNDMTRSMNPLKAYVYASLGVPIVASPIANLGEMSEFITTASGPTEFIDAIEASLAAGRREPDRDALYVHSWDERVERVLHLVDEVVSARPGAASS